VSPTSEASTRAILNSLAGANNGDTILRRDMTRRQGDTTPNSGRIRVMSPFGIVSLSAQVMSP
jgi:hypothetical protein